MKEELISYLNNEKALALATGIIGILSTLTAIYFLLFQNHSRSFAFTMLVAGLIECIFLMGYFGAEKKIRAKVEVFGANPSTIITEQLQKTTGNLKGFLIVKIIYATFILAGVIVLSKTNVSSALSGILIAVIFHFALAITIDNVGERYTQKYNSFLKQYSGAGNAE